jgi:voltage-gated potassium channel
MFGAVDLDALLVPAEVVAHEVYAQLSTPLLWRFVREMPARGDDWADSVVGRLTNLCGKHLQSLWKVRLSAAEAPALRSIFAQETLRLGDLLRSPDDRDDRLHAVVLIVARGDDVHLAPPLDFPLEPDDELLLVGEPAARRLLDSTLLIDPTREYVLHGRHVPSSWIWRVVTRRPA